MHHRFEFVLLPSPIEAHRSVSIYRLQHPDDAVQLKFVFRVLRSTVKFAVAAP